jgi:hypothetical protein
LEEDSSGVRFVSVSDIEGLGHCVKTQWRGYERKLLGEA